LKGDDYLENIIVPNDNIDTDSDSSKKSKPREAKGPVPYWKYMKSVNLTIDQVTTLANVLERDLSEYQLEEPVKEKKPRKPRAASTKKSAKKVLELEKPEDNYPEDDILTPKKPEVVLEEDEKPEPLDDDVDVDVNVVSEEVVPPLPVVGKGRGRGKAAAVIKEKKYEIYEEEDEEESVVEYPVVIKKPRGRAKKV
jgi:hypothetical protein